MYEWLITYEYMVSLGPFRTRSPQENFFYLLGIRRLFDFDDSAFHVIQLWSPEQQQKLVLSLRRREEVGWWMGEWRGHLMTFMCVCGGGRVRWTIALNFVFFLTGETHNRSQKGSKPRLVNQVPVTRVSTWWLPGNHQSLCMNKYFHQARL